MANSLFLSRRCFYTPSYTAPEHPPLSRRRPGPAISVRSRGLLKDTAPKDRAAARPRGTLDWVLRSWQLLRRRSRRSTFPFAGESSRDRGEIDRKCKALPRFFLGRRHELAASYVSIRSRDERRGLRRARIRYVRRLKVLLRTAGSLDLSRIRVLNLRVRLLTETKLFLFFSSRAEKIQ